MLAQDDIGRKALLSYLATFLVCVAVVLGISWLYTSTQRSRFMETGYAVWDAKRTMVSNCDVGQVAVFGDSRADSALIPDRLKKVATNLAVAGGTPIENFFFVKSVLACESKPAIVMLSFNPGAFEIIQPWLWDNSVGYGALGWQEVSEIRHEAERLKDASYLAVTPKLGIDGIFRDAAYSHGFPGIYFNSLLESRLMGKTAMNRQKFDEVVMARGYPSYRRVAQVAGAGATKVQETARFTPLPIQQSYFEATLALLDRAGITTYFLITPYNTTNVNTHNQPYNAAYMAYLHRLDAKYPRFQLLQSKPPVWEQAMFVDGAHLSQEGANVFSRLLDRCIEWAAENANLGGGCNFDHPDQSAKVVELLVAKAKK